MSSEKPANKYLSKYSNGKEVSAAQYITEIICENKARIEKKDLHYRFWQSKEWAQFYRNQISSSHKLLKKHSDKAIIAALKDNKARRIFSLRAPSLVALIKKHEAIIESQNTELKIKIDRKQDSTYQKNNKKGILSKLEELDNEH